MAKYAIPVTEQTHSLCELLQNGRISCRQQDLYLIINTDPSLKYKVGVVPGDNLSSDVLVLQPVEFVSDIRQKESERKTKEKENQIAQVQKMKDSGWSNISIASRLGISENTVREIVKEKK